MPAHATGGGAGVSWRLYIQRSLSFALGLLLAAAILYVHVKLYKILPAYRDFCDSFWEEQKLIAVVLILGAAVGIAYTAYSVNGRHKKFGHAVAAALGVTLGFALFGFTYPEIRTEVRTIWEKIQGKDSAPGRSAVAGPSGGCDTRFERVLIQAHAVQWLGRGTDKCRVVVEAAPGSCFRFYTSRAQIGRGTGPGTGTRYCYAQYLPLGNVEFYYAKAEKEFDYVCRAFYPHGTRDPQPHETRC